MTVPDLTECPDCGRKNNRTVNAESCYHCGATLDQDADR